MKNTLKAVLTSLALMIGFTSMAQNGYYYHKGISHIEAFKEELQLTSGQEKQIQQIREKYSAQMSALYADAAFDPKVKKEAMKSLKQAQKMELNAVLTARQQAILLEKQAEMRQQRDYLKAAHHELIGNVDKERLRAAIQTYHEENILPVMLDQRARLEAQLSPADKETIAELRPRFEERRIRREALRQEFPGYPKPKKGELTIEEQQDKETLRRLVEKYYADIEALYAEVAPQRMHWEEEVQEIVEKFLPEPPVSGWETRGQYDYKGKKHKKIKHPRGTYMKKGHFLLLDPDQSFETVVSHVARLAEIDVYPNPASSQTVIRYTVLRAGKVTIELWDKNGNVLRTLLNDYREAGNYTQQIDVSNLDSGVYYYTVANQEEVNSKKVVISRN